MAALLAVALSEGCGDGSRTPSDLTIGVRAEWLWSPATSDQVGYLLHFLLEQQSTAGICRDLTQSLRVTANGEEVPLVRDAAGCLNSTLTLGPLLEPSPSPSVVEVTSSGASVGEARFANLTPGVGALLVRPVDGLVKAGDELVIVPTAELPSSEGAFGYAYPLEQVPWPGPVEVDSERQPDGLHLRIPAFTGRAAVVLRGKPAYTIPMLSCEGFAFCTGSTTNALGPVFVTESP